MFYGFNQNNSGGYFEVDDKLCHRLFIEANNSDEAVTKAEELGCYWDGVSVGIDCPCCGDRWNYCYLDGLVFPRESKMSDYISKDKWMKRYGKYEVCEQPKKVETSWGSTYYEGKIRFNSIEEYAQYLANEHGWTVPDVRIYYQNGEVKEIFTEDKPIEC